MKAAYIKSHGKLDNIEVGDLDVPKIGANEVLIETKYSALNHLDIFVTRGWPGLNLKLPHILGADGSGVVKEVGSSVTTLSEGDRITINPGISCGKCEMCLSGNQVFCRQFSIKGEHDWGTFAEYFKVPEISAIKIPDSYPFDKAAAAPLTFLTAYRMLKTQANLQSGQYLFIHGAGGGVASAAVQIGKVLGAIVIATTSTPEKMERTKQLGAEHVINYKENKDYGKQVYLEFTKKHGIDVVLDNVGQATFPTSIKLLRAGGKIITCGVTSGPFTKLNITDIFWKHLEIKGSTMANQGEFREVMKFVLEGKLEPVIDKIYPLDEAREAEVYLDSGNQYGKVLLQID